MAKVSEKKRKLDREHADRGATRKRQKHSGFQTDKKKPTLSAGTTSKTDDQLIAEQLGQPSDFDQKQETSQGDACKGTPKKSSQRVQIFAADPPVRSNSTQDKLSDQCPTTMTTIPSTNEKTTTHSQNISRAKQLESIGNTKSNEKMQKMSNSKRRKRKRSDVQGSARVGAAQVSLVSAGIEKPIIGSTALTNADEGKIAVITDTNRWCLSLPFAGRFLDHDVIFVLDENRNECLVAATPYAVQLLALDNSLVIREHALPDGRTIACYSHRASDSQSVDIAYDNGTKVQWNWVTGAVVKGTFPGQEQIIAMANATLATGNEETFYITQNAGTYAIVGERRILYTTQRRLKGIQVLHNCAYIVALSATAISIGARKEPSPQSEYVWIEITVNIPILCADARLIFHDSHKKKQVKRPELALAVGDVEGKILLYTNLAVVFAMATQSEMPSPRVLHWHREPVSSLKFDRNGDYLLSGGKETVLVLWQLDTGKQQFLPHLTSEIERIVVSPNGNHYALQMGDNSIMVLSTSELKPVAHFAGLQLALSTEEMVAEGVLLPKTAALLHPRDPHRLLLSVPSTQPKSVRDVTTRPFLQAFDVHNTRHISRQALTRNNVTDFGTGPEQTPVIPPDVSHIAVSADGNWLATVDEWEPPATDLEHKVARSRGLDADDVRNLREEQEIRREVYLKFWRWNETQGMWTLSTRANSPHSRFPDGEAGSGAGRIVNLASDPSSNTFATVAEDGKVKIWKPRIRTRYSVPLKEQDGVTDAMDWICKRTICLPVAPLISDRADSPLNVEELTKLPPIHDACLSFVSDGSILACGQVAAGIDALPVIYFMSPDSGAITASKAGFVTPGQSVLDIGFVGGIFISLATGSLRAWNLLTDSHQWTKSLAGTPEDQEGAMLAINHTDHTFAVASCVPDNGEGVTEYKVEVYAPTRPEAIFAAKLPSMPEALLAGEGTKGFTIVFADASIRTLSSDNTALSRENDLAIQRKDSSAKPSAATAAAIATIKKDRDEDVEMDPYLGFQSGDNTAVDTILEDDRPIIRLEQLAAVLEAGQGLSMPSMTDMFQGVINLCARSPRRNEMIAA